MSKATTNSFIKTTVLLSMCVFSWYCTGQERLLYKAHALYDKLAFQEAQTSYLKAVAAGVEDAQVYARLGDTFYFNDEVAMSYNWYHKLFTTQDPASITPSYYLRYLQALKSLEMYAEARALMVAFKTRYGKDLVTASHPADQDFLETIAYQSGRFEIKNLRQLNSSSADFGPQFDNHRKQLVFSSSRDTFNLAQKTHSWSGQPFLDLYAATINDQGILSSPIKMSKELNDAYHESSPVFTKDGKTMYFNRVSKEHPSHKQTTSATTYKLKIYRSHMLDGKWSEPVALPFCDNAYSVAHPALSPDETKLYFVSDMPGTKGSSDGVVTENTDLWVVDILSDQTYGEPKNLEHINTSGRETFPFISSEQVLYFSSSGYAGLGGLDIYAASLNKNGAYDRAINLGRPINSPQDDFAFIINDETKIGYFSSNRPGGAGDDDIYQCIETVPLRNPCEAVLTGIVTDAATGTPLAQAQVTVLDSSQQVIATVETAVAGTFTINLPCDQPYTVHAIKTAYTGDQDTFTIPAQAATVHVPLALNTTRPPFIECDDLSQILSIEPLYFDFDKSNIRADTAVALNKIIAFMQRYPQTQVSIQSHTDSRGSHRYNEVLSQKRAQSTRNWLVAQGIDPSRLTAQGFGERQLVNPCSDGVPCTETAHQSNRRSVFIVSITGSGTNCDE